MQFSFQNDVSRFVANIIPLQNIQTNSGGTTETGGLSNAVAELQTMVDYTQKRINTNFMSAYDTGATIQVLSPMNMSNGSFTIGGDVVMPGTGSGSSSISTITAGTSAISLFNTNIQMDVGGVSTLTLNGSGNAVFSGDVYAQQFITLSDMSFKTNIRSFERPVLEGVLGLEPRVFQYVRSPGFRADSADEIGLMAQEVEAIFPECVKESAGKKYINYQALTVVLLKAVKELASSRLN
jgi:hypothetical protein